MSPQTGSTSSPVTDDTKNLARHLVKQERSATAPIPLTARCDHCSIAQAQSRVTFTVSDRQLHLCAHHLREHIAAFDADPNIIVHVNPGTRLK